MAERRGGAKAALPALALAFNAFVWGVSWWPFRELQGHGLHPLWATAGVYAVSLACLLAWRPRAWQGLAAHPGLWLLMLASGMTNVGFNWAVTVGDVVRVVLLFYLMPAWAVLLAWLLLGERPTGRALLRLLLALAGVAVVLKTPGTAWPLPESLADWLALAGGFCFALTNILLRQLRGAPASTRIFAMFTGGTLTAAGAAMLGMGGGWVAAPPLLPGPALALGLALSLGFLAGNMALQFGAARLKAQTTALVMLSEVVFASVSSVLAGASEVSWRTWLGGALILATAAWSAWPEAPTDGRASAQSPA
ncbi:MAG TPA: DMT family transporter [Ramlibacter sp.]|nr:DMT family transporter [Ramlibacter sp.]